MGMQGMSLIDYLQGGCNFEHSVANRDSIIFPAISNPQTSRSEITISIDSSSVPNLRKLRETVQTHCLSNQEMWTVYLVSIAANGLQQSMVYRAQVKSLRRNLTVWFYSRVIDADHAPVYAEFLPTYSLARCDARHQ